MKQIPISRISTNIDFEQDGKQIGYLSIPHSRNESAWGSMHMPIAVIKNGSGPTILLTGGSHGDEYEGPIALAKLSRELDAEAIQGRIILLPALNFPAMMAGKRLSPIDGKNMNRVFPGDRTGTMTEVIAHYVYHVLLPMCDVVLDMHSGGYSLEFVPCIIMHYLDDAAMMEKTLAALNAFGAPIGLMLRELDTDGMFDSAVEETGTLFLTTELAGSARVSVKALAVAETGLRNLLCHLGILKSDQAIAPHPPRLMEVPDTACYVTAAADGIYEPFHDLGAEILDGQPTGQIHFLDDLRRSPRLLKSHRSGILICRRSPGHVERGDCVAVIASDLSTYLQP
ncbi:MAG: N-alpha-acetyl diaminobutyric acid deacetylase DoeB [Elainellaceae cyanobacterium]